MSFYNKIPLGLTTLKTWVTDSISTAKTTIEGWCNNRFSLNTHNHDTEYDSKGAASAVQTNLNTHVADTTKHISSTERNTWNGKADKVHTHPQSDVENLVANLAGKSDKGHNHTTSEISGLNTAVKNICIGFPDYSNAEEISISSKYTVRKNGWISVKCIYSGEVTVNGVVVATCLTYGTAWAYAQQSVFPVSKGDIVRSTGTDRTEDVWFIPCK